MRLMKGKNLALMLIGWISSEILLFYLVLHALGFFLTLALGLLTSLIGLTDLKKLLKFLKINKNMKISREDARLDGALQALASILLILPGFVSDLIGLALKTPSIRANVVKKYRQPAKESDPRHIDLSPQDWKTITGPKKSAPPHRGQ